MAATTSAALVSDHVNYLIFRYLQECGHEATARSFYHDWYRPREYRDPEELPFAGHVKRQALVSVIQDGIRYDELQIRATTSNQRRHLWSHTSARHAFSSAKVVLSNGADATSAVKRKSTGAVGISSTHIEDAQAPASKRQRTVPGDDVSRVNGHRDAMEIDEQSPSAIEEEDDPEAISPTMASEFELPPPPMRYDSAATQTDHQPLRTPSHANLSNQSMKILIKRDNAKLMQAAWNPSKHLKDKRTLIAAGDKVCRVYRVPEHLDNATSDLPFTDDPSTNDNSMVTAVAWHPEGRIVTCAVDTLVPGERGGSIERALVDIGPDIGGSVSSLNNASILCPPGIVLSAEYSPSGDHLMVASTNMSRGLVEVWATSDSDNKDVPRNTPIAWCSFERELTAVAWCEDLQIRACTAESKASVLMLPEQLESASGLTPDSIQKHNFIEEVLPLPSITGSSDACVEYLYDNVHWLDLYFVQSANAEHAWRMVAFDLKHHDGPTDAGKHLIFDIERDFFTAALQPVRRNDSVDGAVKSIDSTARLLAVAFESGTCQIYRLGRRDDIIYCELLHPARGHTYKMSKGPLYAAAWSPDGNYLALCGDDRVEVWHTNRLESEQLDEQPVLSWSSDDATQQKNGITKSTNGGGYRHRERREIALSWDSTGDKLCFAVDKQLAVIEIQRPAEVSTSHEIVMNGI